MTVSSASTRAGWAAIPLALVVMAGTPRVAQAGPWTKSHGELYVKLGEDFFISNSYVDSSGAVVRGAEYFGATTSLYFEVGLYTGLHLQAYLPYSVGQNKFDDGNRFMNAGGGDANFAIQWTPPIKKNPFPWAIRFEVKVPFYDVGGIEGPLAMQFPAFGDGQLDFTFWLSGGYALPKHPFYFLTEIGYRHRTEVFVGRGDPLRTFVDSIVWNLQAGYTIKKRVLIALNLGVVGAIKRDGITKSYLTVGPGVQVKIWRGIALELVFSPIVWARNSSTGYGFGFGVSYQRSK